ncbi:hypothetical protein GLOIN_2v1682945 [Rhizophagus irregularis DAOM 181602=DAOM 197198]|nr:hypothetical protein GLOIN_2v1682945 [Rhizophagus irregularis DAOM 181602=DAOM 197198]
MGKDNKKKNNQSNKDTTSKRPASSSPTGNVSGQGSSMSGPSNTPPSTTSTNKRTRVSTDDSVMDVDKPLTPPGPVETTSAEIPSQPDTSSLDASQHSLSLNVLPLRTRPKLQYNLNLHFSTPRPLLMTSMAFGITSLRTVTRATQLIGNFPCSPLMVVVPRVVDPTI